MKCVCCGHHPPPPPPPTPPPTPPPSFPRRIHSITTVLRCLAEAVQGSGVNSKSVGAAAHVAAGERPVVRMTEEQRKDYLTKRRAQLVRGRVHVAGGGGGTRVWGGVGGGAAPSQRYQPCAGQ
jgi:hypothetical protein